MTPTRRSLFALAALIALGLLTPLVASTTVLWSVVAALFALALCVDAVACLRIPKLQAVRVFPPSFALNEPTAVAMTVHNSSDISIKFDVHESVPGQLVIEDLPQSLRLQAQQQASVPYRLCALKRGEFNLGELCLRVRSPWGLWRQRRLARDSALTVRVYPNFRTVAHYIMLASDNRQSLLGIKQRRRRGQGLEFHQLREYQNGDALRQIDWRATARLHKTISREYRDESDQQLVFILDCGRRMLGDEAGLTMLDHALNAMLMLSYVALRQGDAVGLIASGAQQRWVIPRKGQTQLNTMLNESFALEVSSETVDLFASMQDALARVRRRSLFVLLSNLRDEQDDELVAAMRLAMRRHVVLLASLREPSLQASTKIEVHNRTSALRVAAARQYLVAREQAHVRLRQAGVLCLDVEPMQLTAGLINQYLDIKAGGRL